MRLYDMALNRMYIFNHRDYKGLHTIRRLGIDAYQEWFSVRTGDIGIDRLDMRVNLENRLRPDHECELAQAYFPRARNTI